MNPRTVTTKSKTGDLTVVTRELFGKDRIAQNYVESAIAQAVYPRYGWKHVREMENAVYSTILDVRSIIVQTVSLEGDWPEGLILPDVSDYPACVAFYDRLAELPDRYTTLLLKGVAEVNKEPENPTGKSAEQKSQNARSPVLTALETT